MQLDYTLSLSKELNRLDLMYETDGVILKNYWFRIAMKEKQIFNDKMHAHSFYEIHLCLKGWARFLVDGKESCLHAGEMAFVPKRKKHQIFDISDDLEKVVWGYDLLLGKETNDPPELLEVYRGLTGFCIQPIGKETLYPFALILQNLREKKILWFECIKLYTYCFLVEQTRLIFKGTMNKETEPLLKSRIKMESIRLYILDNLQNGVTVQDVARQMAISERQLSRICYHEFGISVGEYIRQLKMEQAKRLLEETDLTIEEIAERLGYSDRFVFSKAFSGYEGMSPAQFRTSLKT